MGRLNTYLTGLWVRTIKNLKREDKTYYTVKLEDGKVDLIAFRRLQYGDTIEIWPKDFRKSDNAPTHYMRVVHKEEEEDSETQKTEAQ